MTDQQSYGDSHPLVYFR